MRLTVPLLLLTTLLLTSCGPSFSIPEGGVARDEYLQGLGRAGLLENDRARRWQAKAEDALSNPEVAVPPFVRSWRIEEGEVEAAEAYRIELPERQDLLIEATIEGEGFLFVDLYRADDGEMEFVFSTSQGIATFTARRNRSYLVRVQPEIYAEGEVSLEVRLPEGE